MLVILLADAELLCFERICFMMTTAMVYPDSRRYWRIHAADGKCRHVTSTALEAYGCRMSTDLRGKIRRSMGAVINTLAISSHANWIHAGETLLEGWQLSSGDFVERCRSGSASASRIAENAECDLLVTPHRHSW